MGHRCCCDARLGRRRGKVGIGERGGRRGAVEGKPRLGGLQARIDVVDVRHALVVHPVLERLAALLGVNGNAVVPGGASAENAGEIHVRFGGKLEGFVEDVVGDAGGKIDERLLRRGGGFLEV